jgi:hypothetical protein
LALLLLAGTVELMLTGLTEGPIVEANGLIFAPQQHISSIMVILYLLKGRKEVTHQNMNT